MRRSETDASHESNEGIDRNTLKGTFMVRRSWSSKRLLASLMSRPYASSSSACTDGTFGRQAPASRHRSSTAMSPTTFGKRLSFITSDRLVNTLKRDSGIRRRFESFANHQYASESVGFMKNVLEWKAETPGDMEQAQQICATYVFEDSVMQVNI
jgi:hypothetical protein